MKIFDVVIQDYSYDIEAKGDYFSNNPKKPGVTIKFYNFTIDKIVNTIYLEDHTGKFDLHLEDVYIPQEVKNRGYLIEALTKVRKLPEMSGRCKVHVPIKVEAWKSIIERSGFWVDMISQVTFTLEKI